MTAFEDLSDDELHHQLVAAFDEHVTEMFLVTRDMARAPEGSAAREHAEAFSQAAQEMAKAVRQCDFASLAWTREMKLGQLHALADPIPEMMPVQELTYFDLLRAMTAAWCLVCGASEVEDGSALCVACADEQWAQELEQRAAQAGCPPSGSAPGAAPGRAVNGGVQ
ncbi:MAG: hypothetical protein ACXVB5_23050 [Isosphaeraceae bacterium]